MEKKSQRLRNEVHVRQTIFRNSMDWRLYCFSCYCPHYYKLS